MPEDGTGYAASIDSETTLEANVLSELRAMGVPLEEISTPGIAMAIDAEPDIEAIPTVAQGTRDYQEIYTRLLDDADAPLDAAAREEAALPAARDFAERRVEGASEDEAEARRDSAALAAYEDAGPNRDALAVASAAASTGFDRRVEDLSSGERLSLLRGVESFLLLARERLLDQAMGRLSLSASTESEVGAAIDRARSAVRDASSLEAMDDSVESAMEDAESSIREDVLGDVSGDASDPAERVFTDVPQEGRLGRDLEDAGGPAEIASAYLAHAEDVQDHAVSEARQANDRGADLDVEGLAQALTATTAAVSERRLDAFVADTLLIPDATHTWQTDTTGESTFPVTVAESTFTRPGTDSTWNLRIDTVLDAVGVEIDSATLADGPCDLEGEGEVKADLAWSDPVRDGDFSLAWKQVPWTERFDRPVDSCVAQEDTAILTTTDTTDTVPVTVVALQLESDQRFYVEYREPDKDTIRDLNAAHVRLGDDPRTNQLSGQMTYRASGPDQLRQGELDLGELPIEYLLKLVQVEEDTATGETAQQLAHVDTLSVSMVSEGTYSRPESEASSPWRSAVLSVYLRPAEAPRDE